MAQVVDCVFWNLQRLFDPAGLPVARTLGSSRSSWTQDTYERKVDNVAATLRAMLGDEQPALLGLAEVESTRTQADLRDALGWNDLGIVDEHSADSHLEGLDVCLLFNRKIFEDSPQQILSISLDNRFATRDVLLARLELRDTREVVDVFVAHWPSRLITEGQFLRMAYSINLRRLVDARIRFSKADLVDEHGTTHMPGPEALQKRWQLPVIVMGDFNDEPFDASVRTALQADRRMERPSKYGRLKGKELQEPDNYLAANWFLHNPCWGLQFADELRAGGTYYRDAQWRAYDQVMLSHGALRGESPIRFLPGSVRVLRTPPDGALDERVEPTTPTGLPHAFSVSEPTGVSDHLPLAWSMEINTPA